MAFPTPVGLTRLDAALADNGQYDAVLLISRTTRFSPLTEIDQTLQQAGAVDQRLGQGTVMIHAPALAGGRLIHAATGSLDRDYDDVRNIGDAVTAAIQQAVAAGARQPLVILDAVPADGQYQHALAVAYLAICQSLWQPLEARESLDESSLEPVNCIGLYDPQGQVDCRYLEALEAGRRLARDLCGTEPERMAPIGFAEYCRGAFAGSAVALEIVEEQGQIDTDYPLLAAVARASQPVPRHHPRVLHMSYIGSGPIEKTLMLVGKAVTYDTGGADIKVGGGMRGMSRDKGGAAAVAGFMKTLAMLQPKGIKVVASIGAVRNSIGSECFVADEIITGHSGKRVRIGNTDAEGRLVMADLLSRLREQATSEVEPQLFTLATLTGHAARTAGPYSILVENGPARSRQLAQTLAEHGDLWGEGCEISRPRREDWRQIHTGSAAEDLLSSNNGPSVAIARGHQFPMAFLNDVAGLDNHGRHSALPLPYMHIDIAGSAVIKGEPSATPLMALAATYLK